MKVSCKPQTWNAALLKILSSRLVRITLFPLHSLDLNQEPYRSCPSYRVPRSRVTRFSALQRFQRNFLGKIGFNKGDGVATQTFFMLAIIFCYHWYKTVLNTCSNGTKRRKRRICLFGSPLQRAAWTLVPSHSNGCKPFLTTQRPRWIQISRAETLFYECDGMFSRNAEEKVCVKQMAWSDSHVD